MSSRSSYARLERALHAMVRKGELQRAIAHCEKELNSLPRTEYHKALGRSWLRLTQKASNWLASAFRSASTSFAVCALYCEMNRFEINPDEWYVDAFAYDFFGDPKDLGWLVGWKKATTSEGRFVLTGMKDLQALFARDYRDTPDPRIQSASEVVIMLLTLRMQELIRAAAQRTHESNNLPQNMPVLAAAHDSDMVSVTYGRVKPPISAPEPARPAVLPPRKRGAPLAIYRLACGYDRFGNSLPWDTLEFVQVTDAFEYGDQFSKAKPLTKRWKSPRLKLQRRKWRCNAIQLRPESNWALDDKARSVLAPLLGDSVEFLPLRGAKLPKLSVLHPLRQVELADGAIHDGKDGDNMTEIQKYDFKIADLRGKHVFGIMQAPNSAARRAGSSFGEVYASEQFRRVFESHGLEGLVFEKVFSYRPT